MFNQSFKGADGKPLFGLTEKQIIELLNPPVAGAGPNINTTPVPIGGGQGSSQAQDTTSIQTAPQAGPLVSSYDGSNVNPANNPAPLTDNGVFAPRGIADYTSQNRLEDSLKTALRAGTNRNIEQTFHSKPKAQTKGSFLSAFK